MVKYRIIETDDGFGIEYIPQYKAFGIYWSSHWFAQKWFKSKEEAMDAIKFHSQRKDKPEQEVEYFDENLKPVNINDEKS